MRKMFPFDDIMMQHVIVCLTVLHQIRKWYGIAHALTATQMTVICGAKY